MILVYLIAFLLSFTILSSTEQQNNKYLKIENIELKNKLYDIVEDILFVKRDTIEIKQHYSDDMAESGQWSDIFFVFDNNSNPLAVIKHNRSKLIEDHESEYLMLNELNNESFNEFNPIKLLGVADGIINDERYGFIIENVARGKSINNYLKEIGKIKNQQDREVIFSQLKRGVEKTASGLADLHKKKNFSSSSKYYKHKIEEKYTNIVNHFGYIHGDMHVGNVFYDPIEDKTTFIDFGYSHHSKNGGPTCQDVANFIITLEVIGSYYSLSAEEIDILKNIFLTTYRIYGYNCSNEEIEYYSDYLLTSYVKNLNSANESQDPQGIYIYNFCKNRLTNKGN